MIIHCTQKLATKLPNVSDSPLTEISKLGSWHANLYLIDRRQCLMFCHDETRFVLVMTGLKKPDFSSLDYQFIDVYANTMLKLGYDHHLIEKATSEIDTLQFDTACSRSVQGTMRVTKQDLDVMVWRGPNVMDLPVYSASAYLNGRPVTVKGMKSSECLWPEQGMRGWIEEL